MAESNTKDGCHNYFAIASMLNPNSLEARDIQPLQSRPAELLDFKLEFFGSMGFAEATASPGARGFHGVVHTVSQKGMDTLNEIEHLYRPTQATALLYDGTKVPVIVYCRPADKEDTTKGIPQERYLDIMIEGASHYGIKQDYIESLRQLEKEPRPTVHEFLSLGPVPPDLPRMTLDEVYQQDGEDGRPLAATVNGKAFQIQNPTPGRTAMFRRMRRKFQSPAVEVFLPKVIYDPVYGIPQGDH